VDLLVEEAVGKPVADMTAALPLPNIEPSQDKLKAERLAKLVFEQLSITVKADLYNT
jgi:hypothetical protein